MKFLRKNILTTVFFFLLALCFLLYSKKTSEFAYIGLETWYENMIVSLFPFMVLMNLLIQTGLSGLFIRPFYMLLRPIFKNTKDAVFVIFFGYLCGFPLGAKCAVDLYKKGNLSKENTEYLLCFCNNIGPAYMLGFFIKKIQPKTPVSTAVLCFYILPLVYGLILRYTIYKKVLDTEYSNVSIRKTPCRQSDFTQNISPNQTILTALPEAINGALVQIAMLGGYMIVFNALRIIPHLFLSNDMTLYIAAQSILEISGGLICVDNALPSGLLKTIGLYAVFSFNGICCHFQTFAILSGTPFSAQKYMLHKFILCSITVITVCLISIK